MLRQIAGWGIVLVVAACAGREPVELSVHRAVVQQGVYKDATCETPDIDHMDYCLCRAEIAAAVTGHPQLDAVLKEAVAANLCPGEAVEQVPDVMINQRISQYEVVQNDGQWLAVLYTHYQMNAGAAHGMTAKEALIYDKKQQRWLNQGEVVAPAYRAAVAGKIRTALEQQNRERYDGSLWLHEVDFSQLITDEGCSLCILYPEGQGWKAVFSLYSVGPYAIGMPEVQLESADIGRR